MSAEPDRPSSAAADRARRVLGVGADADHHAIRAAFRRRMRELHPDVSGDDSPVGQATAREVIEAYARLCDDRGVGRRPDATDDVGGEPASERGAPPRLAPLAVASLFAFVGAVLAVFLVIALAQSGVRSP